MNTIGHLSNGAASGLTRRASLALAFSTLLVRGARSAGYPERPVTLVVPYAAGGTADILARMIADAFSEKLGRTVTVDNRGGASGMLGCSAVAKALNDGYTLLFTAGGPLTIGPNLGKAPPYNATTDFTPVSLVAQVPSYLVVNPNSPVKTVSDLVAAGRARPNQLRFASPGVGTSVHLLAELFRLQAGFETIHVPYRGGAPAMNDLLGGHVDFMFENAPQLLPQITAGALRALAVTSPARLPATPQVPTLAEAGVKDVGVGTWYGLLAPRNIPADVESTLVRVTTQTAAGASFEKRLKDLGAALDLRMSGNFAAFIAEDDARWKATIARANIEVRN